MITQHTADVTIENHGTIALIRPGSLDTTRRLRNITPSDAQWWGGALACEPRYVADIVDALRNGEG